MDTKFKIFAELFIEFFKIFSIFTDLSEEFDTFLSDVFLDDFQDLVMLEILSADVKREIFRINNSSDETQIFRDQIFTVVHNEHSSNVKLDVVFLLLGFEHIERSSLGNKDN